MFTGKVNESREEQYIEISADDMQKLLDVLVKFPDHLGIENKGAVVVMTLPGTIPVSEVSRFLFNQGVLPTHLVSQKKSLEAQFLEILKEEK